MAIFVLAFIAVVACVLGVSLVLSGIMNTPDEDSVVSVEEVSKIKNELSSKEEEEQKLRLRLDELAVKLEEATAKINEAKGAGGASQELIQQEQEYKVQIKDLERNLAFLRSKADQQAQESIKVISELDQSNKKLKEQIKGSLPNVDVKELEALRHEKISLQEKLNENNSKISELEAALKGLEGQDKDKEKNQEIADLVHENQRLKDGLKGITSKIGEVEKGFEAFRVQSQEKLSRAHQTVDKLESEINPLKTEIEENVLKIHTLEQELSQKQDLQDERRSLAADAVQTDVDSESEERWQKEKIFLEQNIHKLKGVNAKLIEKEKVLHLELTKSRAQVLGLEEICEEFKNQTESQG